MHPSFILICYKSNMHFWSLWLGYDPVFFVGDKRIHILKPECDKSINRNIFHLVLNRIWILNICTHPPHLATLFAQEQVWGSGGLWYVTPWGQGVCLSVWKEAISQWKSYCNSRLDSSHKSNWNNPLVQQQGSHERPPCGGCEPRWIKWGIREK